MTSFTIDTPLLTLDGLKVTYPGRADNPDVTAVEDVSLEVRAGQTVALVGESGSGKSTTLHALLGLLPNRAHISFRNLSAFNEHGEAAEPQQPGRYTRLLPEGAAGLIPQDPTQALDPLMRIEHHFRELHRYQTGITDREESRTLTVEALRAVGIDRPQLRLKQYPHELSGGQRQRVLIALALVGAPRLLLADEPTSNLDTTVQRRILDLFDTVKQERGLSVLLVTHDIAVAAERSDQLVVLRRGRIVEHGPTSRIIENPTDPYTRRLLESLPNRLPPRHETPVGGIPVIEAANLSKTYSGHRRTEAVRALKDLSLTLHPGRTLALVGESGAGKSTALRLLSGLEPSDTGYVKISGHPTNTNRRIRGRFPEGLQLVYQNPKRSLNPSLTVANAIAEPLEAAKIGTRRTQIARAHELLAAVDLAPEIALRHPQELSGGQAQRVAIARALATNPSVVVLDEPVSALDQSVQYQILSLLLELQQRLGVAYVFVSHDLGVVRAIADEVVVLHHGEVVEHGPTRAVFDNPRSPHTRTLLDAIPHLPARTPERTLIS